MERTILDEAMAATFVRRLGEHLDYNINIMNRDGVIIASRDPARIGSFHDAAQRIVATGTSEEKVEPSPFLPAGVRPGVNLPIVFKGETLGVVGVTGIPSEVAALAYAVKTSVESMIELEIWKDKALRRQDKKNLLINYLLYDDGTSRSVVEGLAEKLGYAPKLPRVPLLLKAASGEDSSEVLAAIKANHFHSSEDISWVTPEGSILVFKSLHFDKGAILETFDSQVQSYVRAARTALGAGLAESENPGVSPGPHLLRAYAGAFQTDLNRYRDAFNQTLWLSEHFPEPRDEVVFLYDHLFEYLSSRIPRAEFVSALDSLAALLPTDAQKNLRSTMEALAESALNGKEAAARLGVHRNTLSARIEKLSNLLGRDPRREPRALDLLSFLARYLEIRG